MDTQSTLYKAKYLTILDLDYAAPAVTLASACFDMYRLYDAYRNDGYIKKHWQEIVQQVDELVDKLKQISELVNDEEEIPNEQNETVDSPLTFDNESSRSVVLLEDNDFVQNSPDTSLILNQPNMRSNSYLRASFFDLGEDNSSSGRDVSLNDYNTSFSQESNPPSFSDQRYLEQNTHLASSIQTSPSRFNTATSNLATRSTPMLNTFVSQPDLTTIRPRTRTVNNMLRTVSSRSLLEPLPPPPDLTDEEMKSIIESVLEFKHEVRHIADAHHRCRTRKMCAVITASWTGSFLCAPPLAWGGSQLFGMLLGPVGGAGGTLFGTMFGTIAGALAGNKLANKIVKHKFVPELNDERETQQN